MKHPLTVVVFSLCILSATLTARAVPVGQVDDFQDGSTMNWIEGSSPNPPFSVADGGPDGLGDFAIQDESTGTGGAGSRMTLFNRVQWTGDYLTDGVTAIQIDMLNLSSSSLSMRLAVENSAQQRYGSVDAQILPADSVYHTLTFDINSTDFGAIDFTPATFADVLSNVVTLRIISAEIGPTWRGDVIEATIRLDNIRALPEPASLGLLAVGGLLLARRRRR